MLRSQARSKQRGFSLIEIVVTIAVMSFLLFAAMPSIGAWMDNARIRNVADSLQNGLQVARGEAVRRNEEVSLWLVALEDPSQLDNQCTLSSTSGSWVVSVFSPFRHCADPASTIDAPRIVTGRPVGDNGARVAVSAVAADSTAATTITFNGFGRVTNAGAIRQIDVSGSSDGTRNLRIAVSAAGQVRLCDPHVTDTKDPRIC